jgi:DNA-binding NtrC family response regulator
MTACTLLLVDDEPSFLEAMAERFRLRELTIFCAASGPEALDRLAQAPGIDVVLLDVSMPGMDGIETLTRIKQRYPLVEVIMLTGAASVPTAIDSIKCGAFDYQTKPVDLDSLLGMVEQARSKRRRKQDKLLDARMHPYLTKRQREELIASILAE